MKNYFVIIKIFFIVSLSFIKNVSAQFAATVSTNYSQLVDSLASSGVSVSNVTYTGSSLAFGNFSNGNLTSLEANSGTVLTTGKVSDIASSPSGFGNTILGTPGNSLLTGLSIVSTYDASVLEFDVVPDYDTLSFSYIFGSEDYPENVPTNYFDPIGAFITGANPSGGNYTNQNFIVVPNTNLLVSVNNINSSTNSQYYIDNISNSAVIFDGITTLLTAKIAVVPSSSYHLVLGIADGGDGTYDSGLFLKNGSLKSFSSTTGISENFSGGSFVICGNPITEKSRINFSMTQQGNVIMNVFDESGRLIKNVVNQTFEPGNHSLSLNPSGIQKGFYILQAAIGNSNISSKLIIN